MLKVLTLSAAMPNVAYAYTNLGETCPDRFEVADLSVWVDDGKSVTPHRFGGVLVDVGLQDKSKTYLSNSRIYCGVLPDDTTHIPFRNSLPIALVSGVNLKTVSLKYLGTLQVSMRGSAQRAYATTEQDNKDVFEKWVARAKDNQTGKAKAELWNYDLAEEENYSCMSKPENPDLSGSGNYACLITIPAMPNPNTFVNCNEWKGCLVEFSLENGLSFRASVSKPENMSRTDRPVGIPEAVSFWEQYTLNLIAAFEKVVIPRDDTIELRKR